MKLQPHIENVKANTETLRVFGLILFTDRHPHMIQTLQNDNYWNQFHEITGDKFAIFSCRPKPGRYEFSGGGGGPRSIGMMMQTWREPNENKELLETFHLKSTEQLPMFIVFAQLPDDTILQCPIKLTDKSDEECHARLKTVVELLSNIANNIVFDSKTDDVYNAFSMQIREFAEREMIVKAVKWIPFVSKIVKLF